ncbi:TetR/AcrR family transcriptional regulator [Streptomonospora litoralis]|uniref:Fatty acid metabolism regulator protein n=1 Tax=Streptomonospora litoralis TaxID=2498135 RepID=A0A4P6PZS0_9ACTN|nr:TetR/AcrR family transcriptional regulator [Streptomonospora litoralis]QBI53280.1 Fatty acid metabolism regulator protein [Streptomonospora litoralis]
MAPPAPDERPTVRQTDQAEAERDARAERILDAATETLVALGYRRVTVDDVAKRAGVGKGTVYLHFHTKELLFITVLMRAQAAMVRRHIDAMRADPEQVRPSALAYSNYLMVEEAPITRAMLTGDSEILGSLAQIGTRELADFARARIAFMTDYFTTLRENGVVRTDAAVEPQLHAYFRIFYGYIAAEPVTQSLRTDTPESRTASDAAMLAHVVRAAFETSSDDPALARAAAPRIIELFRRLLTRVTEEIDNQKRT